MFKAQAGKKEKKSRPIPFTIYHLPLTGRGQVILEFTFCMIIILLMLYGITKVLIWTGVSFAERSIAHDKILIREDFSPAYGRIEEGPLKQIDPYFYSPIEMNAIWDP